MTTTPDRPRLRLLPRPIAKCGPAQYPPDELGFRVRALGPMHGGAYAVRHMNETGRIIELRVSRAEVERLIEEARQALGRDRT